VRGEGCEDQGGRMPGAGREGVPVSGKLGLTVILSGAKEA
jgi:hypothetical protein